MGFSVTGGKIASVSAALIHMSHVSFVLPAQFSLLIESEKWKSVKIEHRTKISPLYVNLYNLNMTGRSG